MPEPIDTIATLVNLLASSFTVVDQLTKDLRHAHSNLDKERAAVAQLDTLTDKLRQELGDIKTNYDIVVKANAAIRQANDTLTDQLAALRGEIDTPY